MEYSHQDFILDIINLLIYGFVFLQAIYSICKIKEKGVNKEKIVYSLYAIVATLYFIQIISIYTTGSRSNELWDIFHSLNSIKALLAISLISQLNNTELKNKHKLYGCRTTNRTTK